MAGQPNTWGLYTVEMEWIQTFLRSAGRRVQIDTDAQKPEASSPC